MPKVNQTEFEESQPDAEEASKASKDFQDSISLSELHAPFELKPSPVDENKT